MNSASMVLMVLSVLAPVLASSRASATTLFSDAFQNTTDLSSWTPGLGDAVIATAPDGSHGLSFNGIEENGDINTNSVFTSSTGSFTVSFDIYGNCGHTSGCGAFLMAPGAPGNVLGWVLSDTSWNSIANFSEAAGEWEQVTYTFAGTSTNLGFENWNGSPNSQAQSFYIKGLVLTDNPTEIANGTVTVAPVPLPPSVFLLLSGLGALGLLASGHRSNTKDRVINCAGDQQCAAR